MDNYKKKYDEALERAKVWKEKSGMPAGKQSILDDIFPELTESEDEKIRKELIEHVKDQQSSFISAPDCRDKYEEEENNKYNSWLAWLEKQGEQKVSVVDFKAKDWYVSKVDGKIHNLYHSVDKVKPKFEIGNWVISTLPGIKYPHLITDIKDGYYIFGEDDDHAHIASNDDILKLWSIQDAKDGDVLANDNEIVIFKENNFNQKDLSGCMFVYCSLCSKKGYWYTIGGINPSNYVPATIEQRDLLFSKMKEAGYEWDAENLQLTKILHVKELSDGVNIDKQKLAEWNKEDEEYNGEDYGIDGLWHAQRILENTLGSVDGYQTDDGILDHKAAIIAVKKLYKQKPTWSEEDDWIKTKIIKVLLSYETFLTPKETNECIDWIKHIKQRIGG